MVISKRFGHIGHLLEHLFIHHKRLINIGFSASDFYRSIFSIDGFTNQLWELEYLVCRLSDAERVLSLYTHRSGQLNIDAQVFTDEKRLVLDELLQNQTEKPSPDELVHRHALRPAALPWYDMEKLSGLTYAALDKMVSLLALPAYPFYISAGTSRFARLPRSPLLQYVDSFNKKRLHLFHPDMAAGWCYVTIVWPLIRPTPWTVWQNIVSGLSDPHFGALFTKFRRDWQIYGASIHFDPYTQCLEISCEIKDGHQEEIVNDIHQFLLSKEVEDHFKKQQKNLVAVSKLVNRLNWGNATIDPLSIIEQTALYGNLQSQSTKSDLVDYWQYFKSTASARTKVIYRHHNQQIKIEWR